MIRNSKFYLYLLCILLGSTLSLVSCVTEGAILADSTSQLPTIAEKYPERMNKTSNGMSYGDFIKVWPEARLVGQSEATKAYEFRDTQLYYTSHDKNIALLWTLSVKTSEYVQVIWFYFKDDSLIKWGNPNDWPK